MRAMLALIALVTLAACGTGRDLDQPPAPLGDFKLGHSIVIAPNLYKAPLSREASAEQWTSALDKAIEDRFRRYESESEDKKLYHFGISVEGYLLAPPGVPLVVNPKSILIFKITVWDDEKGIKLNEEPHEITVIEPVTPETFAGSGLTQNADQQLDNLVTKASKRIEIWLDVQMQRHDWFGPNARVEKASDGKKANKAAKPVN